MVEITKKTKEELEELGVFNWGIWEKEISKFDWYYDTDESCYIIEGEIEVTAANGGKYDIKKGDFVVFPKGLKCVWDIKKPVRKHYSFS